MDNKFTKRIYSDDIPKAISKTEMKMKYRISEAQREWKLDEEYLVSLKINNKK